MIHKNKPGYYHLWISSVEDETLFTRSFDKARFLSLIQRTFSLNIDRERCLSPNNLAVETSLLAYSLTETSIHLLIYSLRKSAIDELGEKLLFNYAQLISAPRLPFDTLVIYDHLAGPHSALNVSREIHLLHKNWRHNRYSSIEFYLDDRQSDWVSTWRLSRLYKNQSNEYARYLKSVETETDRIFQFIQT